MNAVHAGRLEDVHGALAVEAGGCAPPVMVDERIDVGAVLRAAEALAALRLGQKRRKLDADTARGRIPHPDAVTKLERAEYLRDQIRQLRGAVEELVESVHERVQLSRGGRVPTGAFAQSDARIDAALARIGSVA